MFVYDALLEAFKSCCIIVGAVCVCIRCLTRVDFRKRFLELSRMNPETGRQHFLEEYEVRY